MSRTINADYANQMINSPWHGCGVFLINLDRSPDRLQLAQHNLSTAGIPFQRIAGFDASREDLSHCAIDAVAFRIAHGRLAPRKAEIGVYQSHLRAISAFIESGKEFGIILEDDAAPELNITNSVAQLIKWRNHWDIVPLFHFHSGGPVTLQKQDALKLTVHLAHISSAAAYMINRHAAQVLIKNLSMQRACIDHALFEHWTHGLKLRGIVPMAVHLSEQAHVSTILVEGTEKLPLLLRLPTFASRVQNARRIFFYAIKDIVKHKLGSD
jgi:glycosyl transferase family 25